MLYKGYIINPDPYLLPSYKLSPFEASDIAINACASDSDDLDNFLIKRYKDYNVIITENGRKALNYALRSISLKPDDLITIITTSQNFYISGCVTKEIEKFCHWNRSITADTKAILVNHEFGFPVKELEALKELKLPIIEDCAYSFNSQNKSLSVGNVGDYVIYSFPKFFPIQVGGMLMSKNDRINADELNLCDARYIKKTVGNYISKVDWFSEERRNNYEYLQSEFIKLGLFSTFGTLSYKDVPGVFMFNVSPETVLPKLKAFFYANGVECSVFYGANAFFIPCHHKLKKEDLDYFVALMDFFLHNK